MSLFSSFFIGGFECADQIARNGLRVDLLRETGHDARTEEDYRLLKSIGITTVREGIRWGFVEQNPYEYDFSEVRRRIRIGVELSIQQCWDMCHFGLPDDLSPAHPLFPTRFAALCQAFVQVFRQEAPHAPLIITPINEISFLAWHAGEMRGTVPFAVNSGWDIKYHLCKAALAGIRAIRAASGSARILMVEPLIWVHPKTADPAELSATDRINEEQFQAMDIIAGRICPELGGCEEYLDLLGFNYYFNNQWLYEAGPLPWYPDGTEPYQPMALPMLLRLASQRYADRPVVISETGHFGEHRAAWLGHMGAQCEAAIALGVPLQGMCIYPAIDRPCWDNLSNYIPCGLWGYEGVHKDRVAHEESVAVIKLHAPRMRDLQRASTQLVAY